MVARPRGASATHTFAGQGTYTIAATATDASGDTGTATVAVAVNTTPPVFAINTSAVPVEQGDFVYWQTHVFVDCGSNEGDGSYRLQMPALDENGAVTYTTSGDPPPYAAISGSGQLTFFTCNFTTAIPFTTYDCYVTATDATTGLSDQYEIVLWTNMDDYGLSMAALGSWQSIDENTSATVGFGQSLSDYFSDVQLVLDQLPTNGTLSLNGSPAQVDTAYPPFAQFQYAPNSNFCGLDTVRAHFTYYSYNTESNGLVGQLSTNIATAAIQVAPLLRIVGSSVLDEAQILQRGVPRGHR